MRVADRYVLHEPYGDGGLGAVFRATDLHTHQPVAVKRLRTTFTIAAPERVQQIREETARLQALQHPALAVPTDIIEDDDVVYVVMPHLPGGSYASRLQQGLSVAEVVRVGQIVAQGLAAIHGEGIVHQNVKPDNILTDENGQPFLAECGITRIKLSKDRQANNFITGTTYYLAPEMLTNQVIAPSIDIWALGVTLFELLARAKPFTGDPVPVRFQAILRQPMPDLAALRPDCPPALIDLIGQMLTKNPAARISSAAAVTASLRAIGGR